MRISDWSSDVCSSDLRLSFRWHNRGLCCFLRRCGRRGEAGNHRRRRDGRRSGWNEPGWDDQRGQSWYRSNPAKRYQLFLLDRKSVVSGKSVSVRLDLGGRRIIKKKKIYIVYIHERDK